MATPNIMWQPRKLSREESNPYGNLLSQAIKSYSGLTNAQYLEPNLKEALKKSQLFNQYYGPNIESQMGLRGAQAGHLGAMTNQLNTENQFLPEKMKSEMAQNALKQQLIQGILGGNFGNQQPSGALPEETGEQPYYGTEDGAITANNAKPSVQGNISFPQASLLSHMLGLGQPKFIDVNGKKMAVTPFGNIEVGKGLTEREKELTKTDVKKISELEDIVLKSSGKQDTLNEVASIISDPKFQEMRQNPILGKHELAWFSKFGTGDQQALVGKFRANTGQIIKDSARDFGGQFRVGEQALLNSMKPNDSDSLETMQGKTEALMYMINKITERSKIESELMREKGLPPVAAKLAADKIIDTNKIKKEIQERLSLAKEEKPNQEEMGKTGHEVLMIAPDGTQGFIPINKIEEAKKKGLRFAD